jgi:hypothetical protein
MWQSITAGTEVQHLPTCIYHASTPDQATPSVHRQRM